MKKTILMSVITLIISIGAQAQVEFSTKPVVGLIGASYSTCQAPESWPLLGVGLAGCSYEGLDVKLLKSIWLRGMTVQSAALSGSFSYSVEFFGTPGYQEQLVKLVKRAKWRDGIFRMKHLVIDLTNDCLHTFPCTEESYEAETLAIYQSIIGQAKYIGLKVYVTAMPPYSALNLDLAAKEYTLANVIGEHDYNMYKRMHKRILGSIEGVIYLDPYKDITTFDGLHPDDKSMRRAANIIAKAIFKESKKKK